MADHPCLSSPQPSALQGPLNDSERLPVLAVWPALAATLSTATPVVLQAPPGAGKSTALPLQLLLQQTVPGRILMLEPRRLAARNIAHYLAAQLGEPVGERVGYLPGAWRAPHQCRNPTRDRHRGS